MTAAGPILVFDSGVGGLSVLKAIRAELPNAPDAYFDQIGSVHLERYSHGRVVLLGDAAYGGTLGGQGTSLAVVGAHVLANELRVSNGDPATAFARYEALLRRYCPEYANVAATYPGDALGDTSMADWFGDGFERRTVFPNAQILDLDGLRGRLMSSSYAPKPGDPRHEPMLAALQALFDETQQDGRVNFAYETRVYAGRPQR